KLPTTAKRLVERHIMKHDDFLGDRILVLKCILLALCIEDVEKIGHATLVTLHGEIDGAAARLQRDAQGFALSEIQLVLLDRLIDLFYRHNDGLPVILENLVEVHFLDVDECIETPKIEQWPIRAGARRPNQAADRHDLLELGLT